MMKRHKTQIVETKKSPDAKNGDTAYPPCAFRQIGRLRRTNILSVTFSLTRYRSTSAGVPIPGRFCRGDSHLLFLPIGIAQKTDRSQALLNFRGDQQRRSRSCNSAATG